MLPYSSCFHASLGGTVFFPCCFILSQSKVKMWFLVYPPMLKGQVPGAVKVKSSKQQTPQKSTPLKRLTIIVWKIRHLYQVDAIYSCVLAGITIEAAIHLVLQWCWHSQLYDWNACVVPLNVQHLSLLVTDFLNGFFVGVGVLLS